MILVTGAAGKTGLAVLRQLERRRARVRALVHRAEHEALARAAGAEEVRTLDLTDRGSVANAIEGAQVVYHICPNVSPVEAEIGHLVVDAARRAGVDRFVFHSVLHPQVESMPHHWNKLLVEQHLFETDLPYTILQPASYMQNLLSQWSTIQDRGIYTIPYAAETRLGMVDLEDVAEAAAIVVTEDGHNGATYELAGPEVLTQTEVAEIASIALGREVRTEVVSRVEWEQAAKARGLDEYATRALLAMFVYYEYYGFSGNPRVLAGLLSREPTRFSSFCERHRNVGNAQPL